MREKSKDTQASLLSSPQGFPGYLCHSWRTLRLRLLSAKEAKRIAKGAKKTFQLSSRLVQRLAFQRSQSFVVHIPFLEDGEYSLRLKARPY